MNNLILQSPADMWNTFCLKETGMVLPVDGTLSKLNSEHFVEDFGGQKVRVDIPESSVDELTGAALNYNQARNADRGAAT